jgi:prepilin-type processing-associated H-X9-DG protein
MLYDSLAGVERASSRYILIRDLAWLSATIGLILGIVALFQIRKRPGVLKGLKWAVVGVLIGGFLSASWFVGPSSWDLMRERPIHVNNLSRLAKALLIYANEDDKARFPPPDKWCDVLLESGYVTKQHFVCPRHVFFLPFYRKPVLIRPAPKKGRSHFALNPNAKPTSPPDTVLLFETKQGWNCSGGPAVLSTENHEGRGCNVAFVDAHVSFVSTEQFGKLRWKPDDDK